MRDGFCETLNREDHATLKRWLSLLPAEFVEQRAWLLMIKAFVLHFEARLAAILRILEQINALIPNDPTLQADDVRLLRGLEARTGRAGCILPQ